MFRSQAVVCPVLDQSGVHREPALEQQLREGMFIFMSLFLFPGKSEVSGSAEARLSRALHPYATLINTDETKGSHTHRWMEMGKKFHFFSFFKLNV